MDKPKLQPVNLIWLPMNRRKKMDNFHACILFLLNQVMFQLMQEVRKSFRDIIFSIDSLNEKK